MGRYGYWQEGEDGRGSVRLGLGGRVGEEEEEGEGRESGVCGGWGGWAMGDG